jgi:periodic tryptophan protein 2
MDRVLATGGEDGKVKLWNTHTGFCFVTFPSHTASVTACAWSGNSNVLLTSSLDGTVRAFDLVRYRNFRTMTTPQPAQLVCLAVDPAGEVVCAGSLEPFEIYVWSLQTGKLLDVLAGHAGPLSGLAFAPTAAGGGGALASSSWDKSVRLWDVFSGKGLVETLTHTSDVLTLAYRPDGKEIATATLDGNLNFWDVQDARLKSVIEGRKDIQGGRKVSDARAAMNSTSNCNFTSICYSSDGKSLLAGGNSRFICIYSISEKILLKKFSISTNLSMEGILDQLNSKRMTEAGTSMDLIEENVLR